MASKSFIPSASLILLIAATLAPRDPLGIQPAAQYIRGHDLFERPFVKDLADDGGLVTPEGAGLGFKSHVGLDRDLSAEVTQIGAHDLIRRKWDGLIHVRVLLTAWLRRFGAADVRAAERDPGPVKD